MTAAPLYEPSEHVPLVDAPWDAAAAATLRDEIVRAALHHVDERRWPRHPDDLEDGDDPSERPSRLYDGSSGIVSALLHLGANIDAAAVSDALFEEAMVAHAGDPADNWYMAGTPGPASLATKHGRNPAARAALLERVDRLMIDDPSREIFAGLPGLMLALLHQLRATDDEEWRTRWLDAYAAVIGAWSETRPGVFLWDHVLYGQRRRAFLGAGHGFAANANALLQGIDLIAEPEAERIVARIVSTAHRTARTDAEGRVTWPTLVDESTFLRVQWCHGAPGFVLALSPVPVGFDERFDDLLVRAGEFIWAAGPVGKSASLCHGTAGNGWAFLRLFTRTGDVRWLERARAFAVTAAHQIADEQRRFGQPHFSLWTGDLGVALFLDACITLDDRLPTIETI